MRIVCSLAFAQLRHHRGRWALLVLGIALVVAVPVVTAGMATTVSAQTIRRSISSLDLADRTLLVSQEADSAQRKGTPAQNDTIVRRQLGMLTGGRTLRELLFRELTVAGSSFFLGGVDDLAETVRLTSGRLPASCTPARCEVVVIGGDTAALRRATASLGVVVVGRAVRTDPLLVSGSLDPGRLPLVLGADVEAIAKLSKLELFGRHYAWASLIDPDRVVALGTAGYVARSADVDAAISAQVGGTSFQRPDTVLVSAQARADTSAQRFGLLGGFAAVLLLGFAIIAALALRRESSLLVSVLARRGGTRRQVCAVLVVETAVGCVLAAVLGTLLGAIVAAGLSPDTGRSAVGAASHAVGDAALTATVLIVATGAVVCAVLAWADTRARAVWRLLDLVAIAALGAAVLATDRGSASTGTLASEGDPLVVALPVLASVVAGVLAARLWGPLARLAERSLPRRAIAGRIGLLGAIRRPLRPVATVGFLTAAVASVVFAGAYRATLLANDADQAAYSVPLDATVAASTTDLVPNVAGDAFGPDGRVDPVLRTTAGITRLAGVTDSVPVVAVDASVLPHVHRWDRTTGSSMSAGELAGRLSSTGVALPPLPGPGTGTGARTVTIPARGVDRNTTISLYLRDSSGRGYGLDLRYRAGALSAALPSAAGLRVVGVGVDESADYSTHHAHAVGEGTTDQPKLSGTLVLGVPSVGGTAVRWSWAGWGSLRGTVTTSGAELRLAYQIDADPVIASADFAAIRAAPVPIAVDTETARYAHGGLLELSFDSTTQITAKLVGVLPRLPTVGSTFVLADRGALTRALDLRAPGRNASEFWVQAPASVLDTTLAARPFTELTVTRRSSVQAELDSDPIGRGVATLLIVIALLALAVAALSLVLLVVGERRDGAGELYAWESDGMAPRTLRRTLAVRMLAVAVVAIPVGVAAGLIVARVGTTLVAVGASGSTPTPPLQVTLGSAWTVLAILAGVGAGLLLGWLVAVLSLRERYPVPAEVDLR